MSQSVTLGGINFQSTNIVTTKVDHETIGIDEAKVKIAHRAGEKFVNYTYASRPIVLEGYFKTTNSTQSGAILDQLIDQIKTAVIGSMGISLVVGYAGTTRTYIVNVKNFVTVREGYTITFVPFHLELEAVDPPFGIGPVTTALATTALSGDDSYTETVTIVGTQPPAPTFTLVISDKGTATDIGITANGLSFHIIASAGTLANGTYIIDVFNNQITYNGLPIAQLVNHFVSGTYPILAIGSNDVVIDVDTADLVGSIAITYRPYYL